MPRLSVARACPETLVSILLTVAAVFCCCTIFSVHTLAQSPEQLASQAAQAMQEGRYQHAEQLYVNLTHLRPGVAEAYSNLGLARYYQKKFDLAEPALRTALNLNAELFVPKLLLGDIYVGKGRYAEALPLAERAVEEQPREKTALRLLATVWQGLGRQDQAVEQYRKILDENPRDEDSLYHLALAYLELGHKAVNVLLETESKGFAALATAEFDATRPGFEEFAANEYRKAIAESPSVPGLRIALANLLLKSEKPQLAKEALKQELAVDPFSYEARFVLAQIALQEGNLDSAIRSLDEAVRIRPEFFAPLPHLNVTVPLGNRQEVRKGTRISFAEALLRSKLAADKHLELEEANWRLMAEQERDTIIQKYRTQSENNSNSLGHYNERRALGLKFLKENRLEAGLQILLPDVARWRSEPQVRLDVARALFKLQRFHEIVQLLGPVRTQAPSEEIHSLAASYREMSLRTMQKLVEIDPESPDLHRSLGDAYSAVFMYDEAVEQYETALKIQPRNSELYFALGEVRFSQMKFELAAQAYAHAAEISPSDPNSYMMQGASLLQLHRPEEAIPLLRRALELQPKFTGAHANLGKALAQIGRDQEAVQELERAAGSDKDGSLHYLLFSLYSKFGEKEKARQALQNSNRLNQQARRESERKLERNIQREGFLDPPGR